MTFNGEQVSGSPFLCRVADDGDEEEEEEMGLDGIAPPDFADDVIVGDGGGGEYGRVSVALDGLGLIPVGVPATFTIMVAGGDDAELAVSVQGR